MYSEIQNISFSQTEKVLLYFGLKSRPNLGVGLERDRICKILLVLGFHLNAQFLLKGALKKKLF